MLTLYQRALALRRAHFAADEVHDWIDLGDEVIAFRRGSGVICVVSFGRNAVRLPEGEVLLASVPGVSDTLPSDAAVWVRPFHEKAPS
jgi:alpha-glucosidase